MPPLRSAHGQALRSRDNTRPDFLLAFWQRRSVTVIGVDAVYCNDRLAPRFIRFRDAPFYLGMDKDRFNAEVRPYLIEIPIGKQGIAFDRLDLDAWADQYRDREGRPGAKVEKEIAQWDGPKRQDSSVTEHRTSGGSTNGSGDMAAFTKALAVVTSKKRNVISTAG